MKKIRISDTTHNNTLISLKHVLEQIACGPSLFWSIIYLDATGKLNTELSIADLQLQVQQNPNGLHLTWDKLQWLADQHLDIIDISLIGCTDLSLLHKYQSNEEMYAASDIVIELFDSSYWEVYSAHEELLESLTTRFHNIKIVAQNSGH
jgi:hypothetical protein